MERVQQQFDLDDAKKLHRLNKNLVDDVVPAILDGGHYPTTPTSIKSKSKARMKRVDSYAFIFHPEVCFCCNFVF